MSSTMNGLAMTSLPPGGQVAAAEGGKFRDSSVGVGPVDPSEESCLPSLVRKLTSFRRALVLERKQSQQAQQQIEKLTRQIADLEIKLEEQVTALHQCDDVGFAATQLDSLRLTLSPRCRQTARTWK